MWGWCLFGVVREWEGGYWSSFLFPKCVGHKGMWEGSNDDVIVRMGRWCSGHHERSKEMGMEGG
jgi:hypothetical protein